MRTDEEKKKEKDVMEKIQKKSDYWFVSHSRIEQEKELQVHLSVGALAKLVAM